MSKPLLFLMFGLFLGSFASHAYHTYSKSSDEGAVQAGLTNTSTSSKFTQETTKLQSDLDKNQSPSPFSTQKIKLKKDTPDSVAPAKITAASAECAQSPSDSVAAPQIDDPQRAFPDIEPTAAEKAEQNQQQLEDERMLAELEQFELANSTNLSAAEAVPVLSAQEIEYERAEAERQAEASLKQQEAQPAEPMPPEQN